MGYQKLLKALQEKKLYFLFKLEFSHFLDHRSFIDMSIYFYQMLYRCFMKHWGDMASSHILTLDLSESKFILSIDCHTASGSIQARLMAS